MRIQIQLRIVADDDSVISEDEILQLDKGDDRLEAIGLSLGEAKTLLAGIQERMVTAQATSFAARHRGCRECRNFRVWAITQGIEGGPYGTTEATEYSRRAFGPAAGRRRSEGGAFR
jgi:hypothetical protein